MRITRTNLIPSHDWHVQPYCQRSRSPPPERCFLDRGRLSSMPSNSLRFNDLASLTLRSSIGATFVRLPAFRFSVNLSFSTGAVVHQDHAFLSALSKRLRRLAKDDLLTVGHALKLVKNNRHPKCQSRKRLSGTFIPWSRNGMFSEGFPTEASAYRPKPFEPLPFIL